MSNQVHISNEKDLEILSAELTVELNKPVEVLDKIRLPRKVPKSMTPIDYIYSLFTVKYNSKEFKCQVTNDAYNPVGLVYRE
jgi:hypothetical protein